MRTGYRNTEKGYHFPRWLIFLEVLDLDFLLVPNKRNRLRCPTESRDLRFGRSRKIIRTQEKYHLPQRISFSFSILPRSYLVICCNYLLRSVSLLESRKHIYSTCYTLSINLCLVQEGSVNVDQVITEQRRHAWKLCLKLTSVMNLPGYQNEIIG